MALKRQHQGFSTFSMASMTDVIFLLLIFFMITSTFMSPSALEVNLPQSSQTTQLKPSTRIYIDSAQNLYYTRYDTVAHQESALTPITAQQLVPFMQGLKSLPQDQQFVAVHADEAVPYGKIVEVLDAGSRAGLKIVLATKPATTAPDGTQPQPATAQPVQPVATEQPASAPGQE